MRSKILLLSFFFSTATAFGQQNEIPYAYNNPVFITDNLPTSVKEYSYDYITQVATHVQNHTFKYNSGGFLTEHIKTNQGISDWYQTFRYRFQYDATSRLIYFWKEQKTGSAYESQREQQWVYDAQDMITENNNWSVTNGTKYLDIHSFKRVIIRDVNNQVLKIEKSIYTSSEDELVLDKIYTFKYDENNNLDSIIVFARNITLGGVMKLESKQYDFDFKNYDVLNIDLLTYNSYQTSNYNDEKTNVSNTFDVDGRMLTQTVKYLDDELINETTWTYETDKITTTDLYEKEINYIDASGRTWKLETYSKNGVDWELEYPSYDLHIRTFENDKIASELYKNYYDSETQTYKNDARYDYTYSLTAGVFNQQQVDAKLLYPNPSAGVVYVNDFQKIEKLSISSVTGTTTPVSVQEQIDLSALPAGVYIVTAEYKDQSSSVQRLILK